MYQDRNGILRIEPLKFDVTDYKIDSFNSYSKSEITTSKPLRGVRVNVYQYSQGSDGIESTTSSVLAVASLTGEIVDMDNPLITDESRAIAVGTWVGTHLSHRLTLDSSWRADVRLDALDIVTNENNYNVNSVRMTDVEFKFNGAFRGTGKGKVI